MKDNTVLTHAGSDPARQSGAVNPPVVHASTIVFPTIDALENRNTARVSYGRKGTPTTHALEDVFSELEQGSGTVIVPSGLAAATMALLAFSGQGDHVLVSDSCYQPTRHFCEQQLRRFGVEVEYFDPLIGGDISEMARANTRAVLLESPGSDTFEIQDLPAIAAAMRPRDVVVIVDNTWSGGLFHKPLLLGADVAVHAGTKYPVGHSDALIGAIVCNERTQAQVRRTVFDFGLCAGPDDVYLTLRGLRTMAVRLNQHYASGLAIAEYLATQSDVVDVLHPALPSAPQNSLWSRDFTGASGLFGFVLATTDRAAICAFTEGCRLFRIGKSWGGFESLLIPTWPERYRTAAPWRPNGQTMRIHVGLESVDDLKADLDSAFKRLRTSISHNS